MGDSSIGSTTLGDLFDDIVSGSTAANAQFARSIHASVRYVEAAEQRPRELAPGACFDAEAAGKSAVAEIAARLAVPGSTVDEWLFLYRTARPAIRDAFDAGRLPYSKFRTLCRTLATIPRVTDDLLALILAAAGRCTQNSLTAAIDRIIADFDAEWHRRARERAAAERSVTVRKLARGQAELTLRGPQERIAAMATSIVDVGRNLCATDPRAVGARVFDAAHSLLTGTPFGCDCTTETIPDDTDPDPRCTYRAPDTSNAPTRMAYIVIDAETAAGLAGEPGYLDGWGRIPADTARALAEDATWQAIIAEARSTGRGSVCPSCSSCSRCSSGSNDDTAPPVPTPSPEVRRGRRLPAGWTPTDPGATRDTRRAEYHRMRAALDRLREMAATTPELLDSDRARTDGHGGYDAPPPGATTYTPSDALRISVTARYAACVHPGCSVPSAECDLDHAVPFDHRNPVAGGWTVLDNLEPLCRHHHGLKTRKQWTYRILDHGIVHIRDPHGRHYFTAPDG